MCPGAGIQFVLADGLPPLAGARLRLRIVGGIGIVLGYSRDEPASGERLQVRLQRVSNLLGIDLSVIHVECKGLQILFPLRRILDRRLRPLVERIVFDAVLFCCGDILRKGVELAFQRNAMLGEDIEQLRQCRLREFSAYRFRRSRVVHVEPNLILPLRSHAMLAFLVALDLVLFRSQGATARSQAGPVRVVSRADRNGRLTVALAAPLFGQALIERAKIDHNSLVGSAANLLHAVACRHLEVNSFSLDVDYLGCRAHLVAYGRGG
jgi:hypothetical protein